MKLEDHFKRIIEPYITSPHPIEALTFNRMFRDLNQFLSDARDMGSIHHDADLFCSLIEKARLFNSRSDMAFSEGEILFASYCLLPSMTLEPGNTFILIYFDPAYKTLMVKDLEELYVYDSSEFQELPDEDKKFPALIKEK